MKGSPGMLDPVMAAALDMEQLPVLPGRRAAEDAAGALVTALEWVANQAEHETDTDAQQQLANTMEALAPCVINLMAYARGRVPRAREKRSPLVLS